MAKLKHIIIKEILLYWLLSSVVMLCYSFLADNYIFKILSMVSILISKIIYEKYASKYYSAQLN